jgi:hypothetical protein
LSPARPRGINEYLAAYPEGTCPLCPDIHESCAFSEDSLVCATGEECTNPHHRVGVVAPRPVDELGELRAMARDIDKSVRADKNLEAARQARPT